MLVLDAILGGKHFMDKIILKPKSNPQEHIIVCQNDVVVVTNHERTRKWKSSKKEEEFQAQWCQSSYT